MLVNFYKYQGTGNDFVIIDLRSNNFQLTENNIKTICNRKFGIGSDGLMIMKNHNDYDFEMKFFKLYFVEKKFNASMIPGNKYLLSFI